MIYVDMDGVLANLYDYMTLRMYDKIFVETSSEQREMIKTVFRNKKLFNELFPEGAEKMFENLDPFPFNKALIDTVMKFGGEYRILSRPCSLDIAGTKRAKIKWVSEHLSFCPPKDIILVHDKSSNNRALNNVLIDDWDAFLNRWEEKGGHPIKYNAYCIGSKEQVSSYISQELQHY